MSFSAADLAKRPILPQRYVVSDLFPVGVTLLAGKPKSGKSYMMMQLALGVATGTPFLNRQVEQGPVLYMALEDVEARLQARLLDVLGDTEEYPEDLHFVTAGQRSGLVGQGFSEMVDGWVQTYGAPKLIIVDTLVMVAASKPGRKTDYEHATDSMQAFRAIVETHGTSVFLVHHTRKSNANFSTDPFEEIMGSQGYFGSADTGVVLIRNSDTDTRAKLQIVGRDVGRTTLHLEFDTEAMAWLEVGADPYESAKVTARQRAVVNVLVKSGRPMKLAEIVSEVGGSRSAGHELLSRLIGAGVVQQVAHGEYALCALEEVDTSVSGPQSGEFAAHTVDGADPNEDPNADSAARHPSEEPDPESEPRFFFDDEEEAAYWASKFGDIPT